MNADGLKRTGLLLEGGGMRGVYTAGVLDCWMDRGLYYPYIIGISSGSWIATSYMSGQRGRSRTCMIDYARDRRAYSYGNWLRRGSLLGMEFLFGTLPDQLEPFDYETYYRSEQQLIVVITDASSGEAVFYTNEDTRDAANLSRLLTASVSLPLVSRLVEWQGKYVLDGGIADSLPLQKALDDGYCKNVLVLNKPKGYRKRRSILDYPAAWMNRRYPKLAKAILERYRHYNRTLEQIERLEEDGEVYVIRPSKDLKVGRGERRPEKLKALYELGYSDAKQSYEAMMQWQKPARGANNE